MLMPVSFVSSVSLFRKPSRATLVVQFSLARAARRKYFAIALSRTANTASHPSLPPLRRKSANKVGKFRRTFKRTRVIIACSDSSQITVTFEPSEPCGSTLLQESFPGSIATLNPEADIHT